LVLIRFRWFLLFVFALLLCFGSSALADDDKNEDDIKRHKWFLTVYGGAHAQDDIGDVFTFKAKFEDNDYIAVAALARELWHYKKYISFEVEGQIGKHFNNDTFWEFNGLIIGRWHAFPWNMPWVCLSILGGIWWCASTTARRSSDYTEPPDQTM